MLLLGPDAVAGDDDLDVAEVVADRGDGLLDDAQRRMMRRRGGGDDRRHLLLGHVDAQLRQVVAQAPCHLPLALLPPC